MRLKLYFGDAFVYGTSETLIADYVEDGLNGEHKRLGHGIYW